MEYHMNERARTAVRGRGHFEGNWKDLLTLLGEIAPAVCSTVLVKRPHRRGKPFSWR